MAAYSEEEQIEVIRKWWAENGVSVIVAIVLAVAALLGWRQWQSWQTEQATAASMVYQEMLSAVEEAQSRPDSKAQQELVKERAQTLIEAHGSTAYADYARLMLARLAVEAADYAAAEAQLREVIEAPASDVIYWLATSRLARLLVQTEQYDAALALINQGMPAAFRGQALELEGDILRAREDIEGARRAYTAALEELAGDNRRQLVQMKLDDLSPAS